MRILTILFSSIFCIGVCAAQTSEGQPGRPLFELSGEPLQNVRFSVFLTNDVVLAGSTNVLRFQLENDSTNALFYVIPSMVANLTNSTGSTYALIEPPHPHLNGFEPDVPAISGLPLKVGGVVEWTTSVITSNDIAPGVYRLTATQTVVYGATKYAWILKASLEVKVRKRVTQ